MAVAAVELEIDVMELVAFLELLEELEMTVLVKLLFHCQFLVLDVVVMQKQKEEQQQQQQEMEVFVGLLLLF